MSGVGKTTAARKVARRYDLWLYSLDSRTYAHAEAMQVPALEMTMNELWLARTPAEMAGDFVSEARARFELVLADLGAIPDDGAPILADGPQLLPELVPGPALFLVASTALQRRLLAGRASFTHSATSDPERAFANRVRRDDLLAERLRSHAVEIEDVNETEALVDAFVREQAQDWISGTERGDVAARRRDENHRRLDQWRRYARYEPRARDGALDFACECSRPGCEALVPLTLDEARRRRPKPFLAHS